MVHWKSASEWRWAGHVARRNDNRWTLRLTEWLTREGKKRRGRQKRLAKDRKTWKDHEEGYIQHWIDTVYIDR